MKYPINALGWSVRMSPYLIVCFITLFLPVHYIASLLTFYHQYQNFKKFEFLSMIRWGNVLYLQYFVKLVIISTLYCYLPQFFYSAQDNKSTAGFLILKSITFVGKKIGNVVKTQKYVLYVYFVSAQTMQSTYYFYDQQTII